MRFYFQRPNPRKPLNPEDDLSMDILRRAEKLANDQYPEASRDPHKSKAQSKTVKFWEILNFNTRLIKRIENFYESKQHEPM